MTRKKRFATSAMTSVVGGMLVGLDEQLLRATPRVELLVERGKVVRGVSAEGGALLVGLPDDAVDLPVDQPGDGGTPPD